MPEAPNGWWYELTEQRRESGLLVFEYDVWRSRADRDRGLPPFLQNRHRSQVREQHQRIITGAGGGLVFRGEGGPQEVALDDLDDFRGRAAFRDRVLPGFHFPAYDGRDQQLDGRWLRELHLVPEAEQRERHIHRYLAQAEARGWTGDRRHTTLNLQVGASGDDGYFELTFDNSGTVVNLGKTSTFSLSGFARFDPVALDPGDTVDSAVLTWVSSSTKTGDTCILLLSCVDEDDATAPTSNGDAQGRARTTASSDWNPVPHFGTGGTQHAATDQASSVQEVIDRAGWASGQAIVVYHEDNGSSSSAQRQARSYDGFSSDAAMLDINASPALDPAIVLHTLDSQPLEVPSAMVAY